LVVALRQKLDAHQALGIDLTLSELAIARQRAPHALFAKGRVRQLPLPDASLDCVLCHMALMLFDDVDAVLAEVRRVLRPGGVFSAVTNAASGLNPVGEHIMRALASQRHLMDESKRAPMLGDPRTQVAEELRDLVALYFVNVSVQSFAVTQMVPRKSLWSYLTAAAYGLDAIPGDVGSAALDAIDLPDPVPWTLPLLFVTGFRALSEREDGL
jgi:ubiquinone/menaquinone biosynthesis C-methylase UbiE